MIDKISEVSFGSKVKLVDVFGNTHNCSETNVRKLYEKVLPTGQMEDFADALRGFKQNAKKDSLGDAFTVNIGAQRDNIRLNTPENKGCGTVNVPTSPFSEFSKNLENGFEKLKDLYKRY